MKLVLRSLLLTSFCTISSWTVSSGMLVVTQSPDVSVMEGETVNITCCWTGMFERAGVAWLKNQTVIKREAKFFQSHGSLKKEAKNCSSLNISNIRTEDSGTYICKVTVEIPSLFESKGSGTIITVREKTNDTDYNNHTDSTPSSSTVIFILRSLPFILLVLIFCCFRNKWTTSQRHDTAAGSESMSAQRGEEEGRSERGKVETWL
ncbi:receptor-type tyrosine-protein phosphatase-like [Oreochromis niloticus]|uniref:receptor-type tyrosine-protein phosphatase-like n=1 Tax=Oreochromis niloticus TaxID=8128 RepID=UPI000DF2AC7B|nr:receptor-type tyrosine-protein phosphatase-like [Oreochromis niloticus]